MASGDIISRLILDHSKYDSGIASAKRSLEGFVKSNLSMDGIIKQCTSSMLGYAGAITSVTAAISNNIETARTFEKSVSQLSSLTGMTGDALNDLKQKAIELGGSSTQTASQVVEAFKLIGSQKPELLKDAEALNEVTKQAITLAEAATMEVPDAAKALTASLNIMGEGASQASRYINVLAAASQAGSVDIQGLTDIVFKAGQAAKLNGLSFEQFISVAETIGPSFGSAAEAGTALNAMLLKLETQSDKKLKPSVVGLVAALKNLSEAHMTAGETTKLVTETGYKALVPLLENIDALEELTRKITGTNTAEQQAITNTDNLDGSLAQLSSAWEKLNLTINDGNGIIRVFVDVSTTVVSCVNSIVSGFSNGVGNINTFFTSIKDGIEDTLPFLDGFLESIDRYVTMRTFGFLGSKSSGDTKDAPQIDGMTGAASIDKSHSVKKVETATVYDDSTDKGLKEHIKALKEQREEVQRGSAEYKRLTSEITRLQKTLDGSKISTKTPKVKDDSIKMKSFGIDYDAMMMKGSDAELNAELAKWQKLYENAGSQSGRQFAANMMDSIKSEIDRRKESVSKGLVSSIKIEGVNFGNGKGALPDVPDTVKQAKETASSWRDAASAMRSVGGALSQMGDKGLNVAGIIMQAVANVALGFSSALAQSKSGKLSVWAWIAEAAAGAATMVSTIAAIKSATSGSYANGGVIGGNSYSGDRLYAKVNSGETILNASQAQTALDMMDSNGNGGGGGSLQPYCNSETIYMGLNAWGKRTGRGELVFARR